VRVSQRDCLLVTLSGHRPARSKASGIASQRIASCASVLAMQVQTRGRMRRREFVALICGASFAGSFAGRAQQSRKQNRIAFVHSGIPAEQLTETAGPLWVRRFYETLRKLGYVEGDNIVIERYSAEGRTDHLTALAGKVVGRKPDVIVTNLHALVMAFTRATSEIPIVAIAGTSIWGGLGRSLARPGGNLTGVSINAGNEITGKRLEILKETIPSLKKVAYLASARAAWEDDAGLSARQAGSRLGVAVSGIFPAEFNEIQIRRAFDAMTQQQYEGVLIDEGGGFLAQRVLIVELAERHRLPICYPYRDYVDLGGLMAYAPDLGELAQRLADNVHQILNGAKPGDIPIYQPTRFQLVVNLKAAKTLGLTITQSMSVRADEIIE
jgi:putative ABC transport system substrate-binding protein